MPVKVRCGTAEPDFTAVTGGEETLKRATATAPRYLAAGTGPRTQQGIRDGVSQIAKVRIRCGGDDERPHGAVLAMGPYAPAST